MNYNADLQNNNNILQNILNQINSLPESILGTDTSDATAIASDILSNKTAYVNGEKITGTIQSYSTNNTITPGLSAITIPQNVYLSTPIFISGDNNLISDNIKKGISIFNVEGSYEGTSGGGVTTSYSIMAPGGSNLLQITYYDANNKTVKTFDASSNNNITTELGRIIVISKRSTATNVTITGLQLSGVNLVTSGTNFAIFELVSSGMLVVQASGS